MSLINELNTIYSVVQVYVNENYHLFKYNFYFYFYFYFFIFIRLVFLVILIIHSSDTPMPKGMGFLDKLTSPILSSIKILINYNI